MRNKWCLLETGSGPRKRRSTFIGPNMEIKSLNWYEGLLKDGTVIDSDRPKASGACTVQRLKEVPELGNS
jgi:hypothetical protein